MTTTPEGWAPATCTLPTAEQPLRVAEFDAVLGASLRAQQRLSATRLRWLLAPDAEERVRELTARESACCSFFAFTITQADHDLLVDVEVPTAQVDVLDALQRRAETGLRPTGAVSPGGSA